MSLSRILSGGLGALINQGAAIADRFITTSDEKQQYKLEWAKLATQEFAAIEESIRARFSMVTDVIKAEMASGDNYTKRARPTVVYAGLFFVVLDIIGQAYGQSPLQIPTEFWYAWSGICGLWVVGRSAERVAKRTSALGKAARIVTGNKEI